MDSAIGGSPALLTVGVTGHRDIATGSLDAFKSDLHRVLTTLVEAVPHTSVFLISGLAEGVDQEAAEVALSISNVRVLAACPMTLQEYRKDFEGSALGRFDKLMSRCHGVIEVLPHFPSGQPDEGCNRDVYYQNFGRWLARNCEILIAGWDGNPPELIGGTADTIYFKAAGLSPLPSAHAGVDSTPPDSGMILWSPVVRELSSLRSGERAEKAEAQSIRYLDADSEWSEWSGQFGPGVNAVESFNSESTSRADSNQQTGFLFESADGVATSLQVRYRRILKAVMASSVVALGAIDALQATGNITFAIVLISMLSLSVSLWLFMRRSRLRERFQEARALAEGARIQLIWLAAGLERGTADSFLAGQGSQFEWIRSALRAAWLMDSRSGARKPEFESARQWLDEQITYFLGDSARTGAIQRAWLKQRSLRRRASVFFSIAITALILDMVGIVLALPWEVWTVQSLRLTWSVGLGVGIAVVSYSELMGFSQLSQRYALTVPYLRQGRDDLRKALAIHSVAAAQGVVRTAGTEALREAGDWLILHSQRQVRPV